MESGLRKGSVREAGLSRLQQEGSGRAVQTDSPGHPPKRGPSRVQEHQGDSGRAEIGRWEDRKPGPRRGPLLPLPHLSSLPSSVKCQQAPSAPLEGSTQCRPRTPGVTTSGRGPESSLGLASLCRTLGARRPPRCPPVRAGSGLAGGGPQPGAYTALLPPASGCPSPGMAGL